MEKGEPTDFSKFIWEAVERRYRRVMRHRERYVTAWIAATGLRPEECAIVETRGPDGSLEVVVKRRSEVSR